MLCYEVRVLSITGGETFIIMDVVVVTECAATFMINQVLLSSALFSLPVSASESGSLLNSWTSVNMLGRKLVLLSNTCVRKPDFKALLKKKHDVNV